ncbi:Down syndrome cell adhesion molecule-like protein Dscam2 [Schistocerca gregaria]|uniref:Down syndrome cell adhesion molecule-like protein Dscam2 n=1 Tax=Schistocerca gregaria TaxID=7010 RepID=UPI00211DD008|nr:Down syndrome cell adhesion molecule-like protein Dscam2 [Schistocerca gregaria]
MKVITSLLAVSCFLGVLARGSCSSADAPQGPVFLQEPPHRADFSNSTGVALQCSAHGNPPPRISWLVSDGSEALDVPGLRQLLDNGTLLLAPFSADQYRPEVHSAAYRCAARNPVGTIVSRRVQIRAGYPPEVLEVVQLETAQTT